MEPTNETTETATHKEVDLILKRFEKNFTPHQQNIILKEVYRKLLEYRKAKADSMIRESKDFQESIKDLEDIKN